MMMGKRMILDQREWDGETVMVRFCEY